MARVRVELGLELGLGLGFGVGLGLGLEFELGFGLALGLGLGFGVGLGFGMGLGLALGLGLELEVLRLVTLMLFSDSHISSSRRISPASVPIIPTFLYAIDHPSPEPQTLGPPLLPGPSTSSLVLDTVSTQSGRSPPAPSSPSPLLSMFDNTTFSMQEVQTTPGTDVQPADVQTNQTTDAAVG